MVSSAEGGRVRPGIQELGVDVIEGIREQLEANARFAVEDFGRRWKAGIAPAQDALQMLQPWFRELVKSGVRDRLVTGSVRSLHDFSLSGDVSFFYPRAAIEELKYGQGYGKRPFSELACELDELGIDSNDQRLDFSQETWRARLEVGRAGRDVDWFITVRQEPEDSKLASVIYDQDGDKRIELIPRYPFAIPIRQTEFREEILQRISPQVLIGIAQQIPWIRQRVRDFDLESRNIIRATTP